MKYFIFQANDFDFGNRKVSGSDIVNDLLSRNKWYLLNHSPYRKTIDKGDKIAFYLAGRGRRFFVGTATVKKTPCHVTAYDEKILKKVGIGFFNWTVELEDVVKWKESKPIKDLLPLIDFIKDKKNYGLHLRQGVRKITEKDYNTIVTS